MEAPTRALLESYHGRFSQPGIAAESAAVLASMQDRLGLYVGRTPLCSVLRPRFVTPHTYRRFYQAAEALLPILRHVYERALLDPIFRRQLHLHDWEEQLLAIEPGYHHPVATSRFDGFISPEGIPYFTEYNAETPAGAGYADALSRVFLALPVMQEFLRQHHISTLPSRPGLLHALLDAFRQWHGNTQELPRIAIVDWREVPTLPEFGLLADYFQMMGIEARLVDPRDLEYSRGRLRAGDFPVTLVYKRVLLKELVEQGGLDHPLFRAARDRAVCLVNSFRCRLLAQKSLFAILTDERNERMFSTDQHATIRRHVPWTRVLQDRITEYYGEPLDLIPHVLEHPERYLLKPNDGFGGRGVIIGKNCGTEWQRAVLTGMDNHWIVQEQLQATRELYPRYRDGSLQFDECTVETGVFITAGEYAHGGLVRLSDGPVVGIVNGGGAVVPLFLAEPRS